MAGLFSKPKIPPPEPPTPLPDEESINRARRRRMAAEINQSSANTTILSEGKRETLGG